MSNIKYISMVEQTNFLDNAEFVKAARQFGKNVRKLRARKRISQSQMAESMGLDKTLISHYERGARIPNYRRLAELANFFGVSVSSLLGE